MKNPYGVRKSLAFSFISIDSEKQSGQCSICPVTSRVLEVHGIKESQPWVLWWRVLKQWGFGFGLKLKNHKIHDEVLRLLQGG